MASASDVVARELAKGRGKRYSGSVWRLGRHALTTVEGRPTDLGHAFLRVRPSEDLGHFNRSTERTTGRQVRVLDFAGRTRVVAKIQDGRVMATKMGQGYYGQAAAIFNAYVPAWRRGRDGQLYRTSVTLDDQWLRLASGGSEALSGLRAGVYSRDPQEMHRAIVEQLVRATREKATARQAVRRYTGPFDFDEGGTEERTVAKLDLYEDEVFLDPDDFTESAIRMSIFAPGFNSRERSYVQEVKWRPLRGDVLLEDDLYRKTGLHVEAFRTTGRCVLYQLREVITSRSRVRGADEQRPRFELDELEAIFDECWEEEFEVGPNPRTVEAFGPVAAQFLELDAEGDLVRRLSEWHNGCDKLRAVIQRFYGWMHGGWEAKVARVRRLLGVPPRQTDDWRQHGVTPLQLEAVCTKTLNPLWVLRGSNLLYRFVPPGWDALTTNQRRNHQPVIMSLNAGHAFFYSCPDARKGVQNMKLDFEPAYRDHARLVSHVEHERLRFDEMVAWSPEAFDGALEACESVCFHHTDLNELVKWFRAQRRLVSFRATGDMCGTNWIFVNGAGDARIRVRQVSEDAQTLQRAAQFLRESHYNVEYHGEGMPSFIDACVDSILIKDRRYLTREQERECRAAHDGACARCGSRERLQYDHVVPLSQGGTNELSNFQMLCRECHVLKTQGERAPRPHLLQSQFGLATLDLFLSTPKPKQQSGSWWSETLEAHGLPQPSDDQQYPCIDVVGCRRNALLQRPPRRHLGRQEPRHLPTFAPCDALEDVVGSWHDYDFVWLEIPGCDPHDPAQWVNVRPYDGAHLYPVETAEALVSWGVVRPESITKGIRASRHFDPQCLSGAWQVVTEALSRADPQRRRAFEKTVYVQHIGLMGVTSRSQTVVVNTTVPEDVPSEDIVFQFDKGAMTLGYETHLLDNRSWFPLSLLALYGEATALCRAWRMVREAEAALGRPLALACHIDGIALLKVPPQLRKRVQEVRYPDGTPTYAIKQDQKTSYGLLPHHPERLWLDSKNRELPVPEPRRDVDEQDLCGELGGLVTDADWFDRLARFVLDNGGAQVVGPGGVGKTCGFLRAFRRLVESSGEALHVVALTHVAAALARGDTIEKFLLRARFSQTSTTWLAVDECSQIPQCHWAELLRLRLVGFKFVILGDWEGQLRPPSDLWSDARLRYEDSQDLWSLSQGLRVRLSHYRRGVNLGFFRYYCGLYQDIPEDDRARDHTQRARLAAHLRHALTLMPWDGDYRALHVVMSNSTRKHINRLCNELHRREQRRTVLVESRDAGRPDGEPSFHCYVGQELQARLTCKKMGVFKNVLYSVQSISRHDAVLRMSPEYSDSPQNASFPLAELARYFRMAYAVVYMNVQGRTIREGAVVLWNTLRGACPHRYLTMRHFVMGLQRVVDPRNLKIASYQQEREFLGAEPPEDAPEAELDEADEEAEGSEDDEPAAKRPRYSHV